jgi:hypothetical protein
MKLIFFIFVIPYNKKMQHIISLFLLLLLFVCCTPKAATNKPETSDAELKNEVINIVKNYADEQLRNATTSMDIHGIITMADNQKKMVIDPQMIFTGLIDQDNETDAIASILIFMKDGAIIDEHLILLYRNGCLEFVSAIDRNIKILQLTNRRIVADLHTKPRSNPLYNCHSCTERVTYQYSDGDLVLVK